MDAQNLTGLLISYLYAGSLLVIAELLHRYARVPQPLTRKFVHVCAGLWVFGVLGLFSQWEIGIIPFASFILLNYLIYRVRLLKSVDAGTSSLGTVYFALSITILFILLWRPRGPLDHGPIAAAGAMAMTIGDALAALVGERFGRHRYRVLNSTRSWEGTLAMFLGSAFAILLVLLLLPGSAISPFALVPTPQQALAAALAGAAAAAAVEAVSPHGLDNLSVPLLSALVVWLVLGV